MIKTHWTLEDIRDGLKQLDMGSSVMPPAHIIEMIMYVERLFYNKHMDDIRARRDGLKNMWTDDTGFLSFWFPDEKYKYMDLRDVIFPGCYHCLHTSVNHIRHSTRCSQNCEFCYYHSVDSRIIGKGTYGLSSTDMTFTLDEMLLLLSRQVHNHLAIGWLQKEPLEELDTIEPIMRYIKKRGVHQYMYTNGILATYPVVDKLAEWGLNELRFNLQSSNFSDDVLDNMKYAAQKIQWVGIESPMYSKSFKNFVKHKERILDSGIHQINLPELQICSLSMLDQFEETEGPVYKHRRGYISPISSRHYTYDLIELAEREKWDVIINDCSNDTKFYRGAVPATHLGVVSYDSAFELPFKNVAYLANQILEEGVEYEFF